MSITFENEANILMWTFGKSLATFEQRHNPFATQCIWWIAALVQLDPALSYYLEYWRFPTEGLNRRELKDVPAASFDTGVSSTLRDVQ